jgi:hypothetical protein
MLSSIWCQFMTASMSRSSPGLINPHSPEDCALFADKALMEFQKRFEYDEDLTGWYPRQRPRSEKPE